MPQRSYRSPTAIAPRAWWGITSSHGCVRRRAKENATAVPCERFARVVEPRPARHFRPARRIPVAISTRRVFFLLRPLLRAGLYPHGRRGGKCHAWVSGVVVRFDVLSDFLRDVPVRDRVRHGPAVRAAYGRSRVRRGRLVA